MARANKAEEDVAFADDDTKEAQRQAYALGGMRSNGSSGGERRPSTTKDLDADFKPTTTRELGHEEDDDLERIVDGSGGDAGTLEDGSVVDRAGAEYKVYKKRWFGLVALTFLNIIVSWDVSFQVFIYLFIYSCCTLVHLAHFA